MVPRRHGSEPDQPVRLQFDVGGLDVEMHPVLDRLRLLDPLQEELRSGPPVGEQRHVSAGRSEVEVVELATVRRVRRRSSIGDGVENGLHIEDGSAVQGLEVPDKDPRAVDGDDLHPVQSDRVRPIRRTGAEHSELRA